LVNQTLRDVGMYFNECFLKYFLFKNILK